MIRYQIEVRHQGLKKYRMIRGNDEYVLKQKAQAQLDAWNGQWRQKAERQNKEIEKQKRLSDKQSKLEEAANKTEQAIQAIEDIQFLLKNSLKRAEIFNWEKLRNNDPFPEPFPTPPKPLDVPSEPRINDLRFKPVLDRKSTRLNSSHLGISYAV